MSEWIEEESNIKFVCWNEPKDSLDADACYVVKKGESFEAHIISADEVMDVDEDGVETMGNIKFRLKISGIEEDVMMWSNAAIKRQYTNLGLVKGDDIKVSYIDDYKTSFGKMGRNVRIAVKREQEKKKK